MFSSPKNIKRFCIKHFLYTIALHVFVSELPGVELFTFFGENFRLYSLAF